MYTEEQMDKILAQVEEEFSGLLAKAEEDALNKSEPETPAAEEVAAEATPVEAAEGDLEKNEDEPVQSYEYDDEDKAEVEKLYASMDKSEAEIHYRAVKKAMGMDAAAEPVETVAKSEETEVEDLNKAELVKAEEQIKTLEGENEDLKKSVDSLTEALGKFLKAKPAPKGKAVTGLNYIAKSEGSQDDGKEASSLSKSEINQILSKKAADPTISSQDRESINDYCLNNGSLDSIRHLLQNT
jgi:hypothetical protein